MNNQKQYTVIIIEPSPIVRIGLKTLLNESHGFIVQNMYSDFQSFRNNHADDAPNIIIINPAIISFYQQFSIKTLFADCNQTMFAAILYKYIHSDILHEFNCLLDICDDTPTIIKKLQDVAKEDLNRKKTNEDDNPDLSEREKEILASVAKGLTNKEIADKHHISIHTVVSHRKNIIRKTGIKTVSGLTLYAMFKNLISQSDLH